MFFLRVGRPTAPASIGTGRAGSTDLSRLCRAASYGFAVCSNRSRRRFAACFVPSNPRLTFAAAIAIVGALAGGEECLPGDAGRIVDPRFLGLGVAAIRLALFDHTAARPMEPSVNLLQFGLVLDLDAEMIEPGLPPTGRDRKIHARIVEHPL